MSLIELRNYSFFFFSIACSSSVPDKRQGDTSTKAEAVFDGVHRFPCICYCSEAPVTGVLVDMCACPTPASVVLCIGFSDSLDLHLRLKIGQIFELRQL